MLEDDRSVSLGYVLPLCIHFGTQDVISSLIHIERGSDCHHTPLGSANREHPECLSSGLADNFQELYEEVLRHFGRQSFMP